MKKNLKLKNFYDRVYIKGEDTHFSSFVTKKRPFEEIDQVLEEISWKNKKVLEVGCGTGKFAYNAAKKGAVVLAIDFSDEAIKSAKKKYFLPNLKFEQKNVSEIKDSFDVIVSIGTLEHMDYPLKTLKFLKKHIKLNGKIIITSPNWINPRGYLLLTLWYLFKAPITLVDLHYQTPMDFIRYAKKLDMQLNWKTIDRSSAHGEDMIKDLIRRLPKVLSDSKLSVETKRINELIRWLKENVVPLDNSLPQSGAVGVYVFSQKKILSKRVTKK